MVTRVKTIKEIEAMRISGQMLAQVLYTLSTLLESGMTTKDLADIAAKELKALGGEPAFLNYQGFPDVLCVSINDEVVHGIPTKERQIQDNDLVSLDFGVSYQEMITDAAITLYTGRPSREALSLIETTQAALEAGIAVVKHKAHIGDIGAAVQDVLQTRNYGIVRDLVGHGVGHQLHEEPHIPNTGFNGNGFELLSGMTIAVEPMATLGNHRVFIDNDGWTFKTYDGSLSAHFEHTLLVTDRGAEILTKLNTA